MVGAIFPSVLVMQFCRYEILLVGAGLQLLGKGAGLQLLGKGAGLILLGAGLTLLSGWCNFSKCVGNAILSV